MVNMDPKDLLRPSKSSVRRGMDFMAVHSALNWAILKARYRGRTGDRRRLPRRFLPDRVDVPQPEGKSAVQILRRCPENPEGSRHGPVHRRHAIRPGSNTDSLDAAQVQGLIVAGELAKRALEADVQVMIEGPGHVPLNQIAATMQLRGAAVPRPLLHPRLPRHRRRAGL